MNKSKHRTSNNDFWIDTPNGKMYIKWYQSKLVITASPAAEKEVAGLIGPPTGRDAPNSINYAKWEVRRENCPDMSPWTA
jgi:hypothetical protein